MEAWLEIDRYAVALSAQSANDILSHYDKYEFHPVVAKLLMPFCSEDLGGFYLDVLKGSNALGTPRLLIRRAARLKPRCIDIAHRFVMSASRRSSRSPPKKRPEVFPAEQRNHLHRDVSRVPGRAGCAGALLDKWTLLRAARSA